MSTKSFCDVCGGDLDAYGETINVCPSGEPTATPYITLILEPGSKFRTIHPRWDICNHCRIVAIKEWLEKKEQS